MQDNAHNTIRDIGRVLSVAIAALLFGSTMILSAVGPARAGEAPATLRYMA